MSKNKKPITIQVVGGESITIDRTDALKYHASLFHYAGVLSTFEEYKECDYYVEGMTMEDCDNLVKDKAVEMFGEISY